SVGGSDVTLTLAAGPYLRIEGTGVQLVVAGQALTADVAFERVTDLGSDGLPGGTDSAADSSIIRVGVANLQLGLGPLSVSGGSGFFLVTPTAAAGTVQGTVALNAPQVSVSGNLKVRFNTSAAPVHTTFQVGATPLTLDLPIGPFLEVSGTGVDVSVLGQTLHGDFSFTKNADGRVRITAPSVVLKPGGSAAAPILPATQVASTTAIFELTPTGVAGTADVQLTLNVPNASLTGTFGLRFNTRPTAALGLPAGTFLRIEGTNLHLQAFGQDLQASFAIEQVANNQRDEVVRIGVLNGSLSLGGGVVTVSGVTGTLVALTGGVAGTVSATVGVSAGAGLSFGGAFSLSLDTTEQAS